MYPFIDFLGLVNIPTYAIMIALGVFVCILVTRYRCKKNGGVFDNAAIAITCAGGMAIVFGKLLFLMVSVPLDVIVRLIQAGQAAHLLEGGQIFYGGAIGALIGAFIGLKITKSKAELYVHAVLPGAVLGHAFGRIGCLLGGCCYGIPYSGPFAVIYTNPITDVPPNIPLFPVQGLEAMLDVVIFFILVYASSKKIKWVQLGSLYAALYSIMRFALEYLRYDAVRGKFGLFTTSQWISIVILLLAIIAALVSVKLNKNKTTT